MGGELTQLGCQHWIGHLSGGDLKAHTLALGELPDRLKLTVDDLCSKEGELPPGPFRKSDEPESDEPWTTVLAELVEIKEILQTPEASHAASAS